MNLTKTLALLTLTIAFWLSAAHAQELSVRGESPITNRFFALQKDCRDARHDAITKANTLCRRLRHRNADARTFRQGGCWTFVNRSITLRFSCE